MRTEILVVGGGLGGVAAALAAARAGRDVVLTEPTDWVGGQLTAQAVPPDEHPWIERFGCTASYRALREGIRAHYRAHYPLTAAARATADLNPGAGRVSALCCEPRAALAVLEAMLGPSPRLVRHAPVAAAVEGDHVKAVTLRGPEGEITVEADWVIDATETGELLALAGCEHVTGIESQAMTGEPHAPARARPESIQAPTWCFALDHRPGEDHTIGRPAGYERWRSHLGWLAPDPKTGVLTPRRLEPNPDGDPAALGFDREDDEGDRELWTFRRIAARANFAPGAYASDITIANWPQLDCETGDADDARELSLSFLHWLQAEQGLEGLRLRGDVTGTHDGLAKALYVRESRRIRAEHTIVEHELGMRHADSVGIGSYRIDLHPRTGGEGYLDVHAPPFEIPLGALVPVRMENLLPGAKNLGTTHITNGCHRLHPVEWNVGEVAGALAAFCAQRRSRPREVRARPALRDAFRERLARDGVELSWPAAVRERRGVRAARVKR
ncbi:MAG TPA: FAD-dependent oxidoreductase [Solirubrobacteraceae bacterium]